MNDTPEFLKDEQCVRCKGPIKAEPYQNTTFNEATMDYIRQTVWECYMCGKEHTFDAQPYYVL